MFIHNRIIFPFLVTTLISSTAVAEDLSLGEALTNGKINLNFRYRIENVDQDGLTSNATASTLRSKIGYKTKSYRGFSAFIELENSFVIGAGNYNDTINGKTAYPVIADPESTELNQAYLRYDHESGLWATVGRVGLNIGSQRLVGTVGWRQNDQTYDTAGIGYKSDALKTSYFYLNKIHRIFSGDSSTGTFKNSSHLFNGSYKVNDWAIIEGTVLLLDLNTDFVQINSNLSSQTYSLKLSGKGNIGSGMKLSYAIETARQSDYATTLVEYSADYLSTSVSLSKNNISILAGYEKLGSDNGKGFSTPLATLHKFNGFADKFLSTPANGLVDSYITLGYTLPRDLAWLTGTKLAITYHDFKSDVNDIDYGTEWDLVINKKFNKTFSLNLKAAQYKANSFATDTTKLWATLTAVF